MIRSFLFTCVAISFGYINVVDNAVTQYIDFEVENNSDKIRESYIFTHPDIGDLSIITKESIINELYNNKLNPLPITKAKFWQYQKEFLKLIDLGEHYDNNNYNIDDANLKILNSLIWNRVRAFTRTALF